MFWIEFDSRDFCCRLFGIRSFVIFVFRSSNVLFGFFRKFFDEFGFVSRVDIVLWEESK